MRGRRAFAGIVAAVALSIGAGLIPAHAATPLSDTASMSAEFSASDATATTGVSIPITITASTRAVKGATLSLDLRHTVLTSASDVTAWLEGTITSLDWGGDRHVDTYPLPTVKKTSSKTTTVTATGPQLALSDLADSRGFVPFSATIRYADASTETVRGIVPWNITGTVGTTRIVVPIAAPASADALYTQDELDQWTSPGGELAALGAAVNGVSVILAIDPKIVASIEALDDDTTASDWLENITNDHTVVPLTYGNADIGTLAAAGLDELPAQDDAVEKWAGTSTVWTDGSSLTDAALSLIADSGYQAVTVPSDRIDNLSWKRSFTSHGLAVWVTDSALTSAVSAAVSGSTVNSSSTPSAATVTTDTLLIDEALATRALAKSASVDRLVVLPTNWAENGSQVRALVSAFNSRSWAGTSTSLPTKTETKTRKVSLTGTGVLPLDTSVIGPLVSATNEAEAVASLVTSTDDAESLQLSLGRTVLSLASPFWAGMSTWASAIGTATEAAQTTADAVHLAPQASVRLVSNESELPVPVVNNLPYAVTVRVSVQPSSGQLVVTKAAAVTIEPNSTAQVLVPVRAVANGSVTLRMQLVDSSGNAIGEPVNRSMTVSAEWESVTAVGVAAVVALLFGIGLVRGIRRSRARLVAVTGTVGVAPMDVVPMDGVDATGDVPARPAPESHGVAPHRPLLAEPDQDDHGHPTHASSPEADAATSPSATSDSDKA